MRSTKSGRWFSNQVHERIFLEFIIKLTTNDIELDWRSEIMDLLNQYNSYTLQNFPHELHPLPFPLDNHAPSHLNRVSGLSMASLPPIPNPPTMQGTDVFWRKLLDKLAESHVPSRHQPTSTWQARKTRYDDNDNGRRVPRLDLSDVTPSPVAKESVSDRTTYKDYGSFYAVGKDTRTGRVSYRVDGPWRHS